jgi:2-polyprenyl-6-methoxyphenol hydroxylase-like FAD-dependent oxidoreductase
MVDLKEVEGETVELSFEVSGEVKIAKADLVVGADGIRSSVRKLLIGDSVTCVTSIVL